MKRFLIVIGLTLVASFTVFTVRHAEPLKNERLFQFPKNIGGWVAKEIKMEDWVFESLSTKYAILRDYTSKDGQVVNLAITWYDDKEVAFHSPEACLGGVGSKVKEMTIERINIDHAGEHLIGRIIAESGGTRLLVLYYFITDGYVTPNQTDLRKRILLRRIGNLKRTSAAFVRLMIPIAQSEQRARDVLLDFMRTVFPYTLEFTDTATIKRT
jgi:EpsI family protein